MIPCLHCILVLWRRFDLFSSTIHCRHYSIFGTKMTEHFNSHSSILLPLPRALSIIGQSPSPSPVPSPNNKRRASYDFKSKDQKPNFKKVAKIIASNDPLRKSLYEQKLRKREENLKNKIFKPESVPEQPAVVSNEELQL